MNSISKLAMRGLIAAAFVAALTANVFAQTRDPGERQTTKSVVQGAKDNAAEAGRAARESGREVKAEVKKGTRAAKRRVAVAMCNDGKYSYTRTNTCSDHGGIKERLKK
jgi:hypothetical protein